MQRVYIKNKNGYCACVRILYIDIPKEIEKFKEEILKDIKRGLEVSSAGAAAYSSNGYVLDLEYEGRFIC